MADADIEHETSTRKNEMLRTKAAFDSTGRSATGSESGIDPEASQARPSSAAARPPSAKRGLADIIKPRVSAAQSQPQPRAHAANLADLSASENMEDISEFHSQLAGAIVFNYCFETFQGITCCNT